MEAYSEVVRDSAGGLPNAPAVSIPAISIGQNPSGAHCNAIAEAGFSMYYTNAKIPAGGINTRTQLENTANNLISANIPLQGNDGRYTCCEGQIVSRLFDTNPPNEAHPLFPQIINDLIVEANLAVHHIGAAQQVQITNNHIILVVLHIHSHFDPCAKCSRVLSGLSRQMNMPADMRNQAMRNLLTTPNFAAIENLLTNLSIGQARFLIEVSSNEPYRFNGVGNIDQVCSCAELGGLDGNAANQVNIPAPAAIDFDINGATAINMSLSIPDNRNWHFPLTFSPYVIYGRIAHPGGGVIPPAPCQNAHPQFNDGMPHLPAVP